MELDPDTAPLRFATSVRGRTFPNLTGHDRITGHDDLTG